MDMSMSSSSDGKLLMDENRKVETSRKEDGKRLPIPNLQDERRSGDIGDR